MPDHLAVIALAEALSDIATARKHANPKLALLEVVVCALARPKTRLARELEDRLIAMRQCEVMDTGTVGEVANA